MENLNLDIYYDDPGIIRNSKSEVASLNSKNKQNILAKYIEPVYCSYSSPFVKDRRWMRPSWVRQSSVKESWGGGEWKGEAEIIYNAVSLCIRILYEKIFFFSTTFWKKLESYMKR